MGQFGRLPVSRVDVCIVMVGRLLECPDLISSLKAFSRYLVVYAYPGWTSDSLELEQALLLAGLKATQVYGGIAAVVPSEH